MKSIHDFRTKSKSNQVQASTIHVLHADVDLSVTVEGAIETNYVGGIALVENPKGIWRC